MQFEIDINTLKKYISKLNNVISSTHYILEYTGVYIEVFKNRIILRAINDVIYVKVEINNDLKFTVKKEGSAHVKIKYLNEILGKITTKKVVLTKVEENLLVVKAKNFKYNLTLLRKEKINFTDIIIGSNKPNLSIAGGKFKNIVDKINYFVDEKSPRKILQTVNIQSNDKGLLEVVATDGVKIALLETDTIVDKQINLNIPVVFIRDVIKIIDTSYTLNFYLDTNKIIVVSESIIMKSSLIDGHYPKIKEMIPARFKNKLIIDKTELVNLLDSTLVFKNNGFLDENTFVKMSFINKKLIFESRELELGDSVVKTSKFQWKGYEEFVTQFNPKHIFNSLKSIDEDELIISFNDKNLPFMVTGNSKKDFKALIMPYKM